MAKKAPPLVDMEEDAGRVSSTSVAELRILIGKQVEVETTIATLTASLKEQQKELDSLTMQVIPAFFDQVGVKEITLPDGTKVTVEEKVYPNISKADWPAAYAWLKKNKLESLVKNEMKVEFGKGEEEKAEELIEYLVTHSVENFTNKQYVHPQTLGAFVRERLAEGKDIPASISVNPVRKSVVTKPK